MGGVEASLLSPGPSSVSFLLFLTNSGVLAATTIYCAFAVYQVLQ